MKRVLVVLMVLVTMVMVVEGEGPMRGREEGSRSGCIPADDDITGYAFYTKLDDFCIGRYFERNYSLSCKSGEEGISIHTCGCYFDNNFFVRNPNENPKHTYTYRSSRVWSDSFCTIDPEFWLSKPNEVTKTIATDPTACENWCRARYQFHKVFLPYLSR